jgi:adenine-specific DNA-methyltransferase
MKYMGSKRAMLQNGLGEVLKRQTKSRRRFVDLFSGSGAVAIHVAQNSKIPVVAWDIQRYSAVLANAVISRKIQFAWKRSWNAWYRRAKKYSQSYRAPVHQRLNQPIVRKVREWCFARRNLPITKAYGGHYFSALQAVWIDALRATLPTAQPARTIALAALIRAASRCAAAPGHTAQPFQPTRTAKKYLLEAWQKSIVAKTKSSFQELAEQYAQSRGKAVVGDANEIAKKLRKTDLAFIDPPYSGVHYSRFYHVLETIARGRCGEVSGVGRYPAPRLRPQSKYSVSKSSGEALNELLENVANRGAKAIITFPARTCSNGLSGKLVREIASEHFRVRQRHIKSKFSSLGGTGKQRNGKTHRKAQKGTKELILFLSPRPISNSRNGNSRGGDKRKESPKGC